MTKAPLVDRMRAGLDGRTWTRVHVLLIVALSAGSAFLVSVLLLALHLHSISTSPRRSSRKRL